MKFMQCHILALFKCKLDIREAREGVCPSICRERDFELCFGVAYSEDFGGDSDGFEMWIYVGISKELRRTGERCDGLPSAVGELTAWNRHRDPTDKVAAFGGVGGSQFESDVHVDDVAF